MTLYSPPTWRKFESIEGSLRYSVPVSQCVYRKAGVWHVVVTPGIGVTDGADYVFDRPTEVSPALYSEIISSGVGGS